MGSAPSRPKAKATATPPPPSAPRGPIDRGPPDASLSTQPLFTNLSVSIAKQCRDCKLKVDTNVTTSSVKLSRTYGSIKGELCQKSENETVAFLRGEVSFSEWFKKIQTGNAYEFKKGSNGQFCQQFMLDGVDASKITSYKDYIANVKPDNLKVIRIRRVTGEGSFSSDTKAKFKLSLPIKFQYVQRMVEKPSINMVWKNSPKLHQVVQYGPKQLTSQTADVVISSITLYHPAPLRIDNVQYDAVLSINDPSDLPKDATEKVVILVPLKASNIMNKSTDFFSKIVTHVMAVSAPDPVTNEYAEVEIPTGKDWNISKIFSLDTPDDPKESAPALVPIADSFFSWVASTTYERVVTPSQVLYTPNTPVRYFMLEKPVSISSTDLSYLTRSLPVTAPEDAIHRVPDPSKPGAGPIVYKPSNCKKVREHMENPGPGDILGGYLFGGGASTMLTDDKGQSLGGGESCDPFANNAKKLTQNPSWFTPDKVLTALFNVFLIIAIGLGAWLALFLIANKDYDNKYREFSETAGKVVAKLALQTSGKIQESTAGIGTTLSRASSFVGLPRQAPAAESSSEAPVSSADAEKALGSLKGLGGIGKLGSLFGKLGKKA